MNVRFSYRLSKQEIFPLEPTDFQRKSNVVEP